MIEFQGLSDPFSAIRIISELKDVELLDILQDVINNCLIVNDITFSQCDKSLLFPSEIGNTVCLLLLLCVVLGDVTSGENIHLVISAEQ